MKAQVVFLAIAITIGLTACSSYISQPIPQVVKTAPKLDLNNSQAVMDAITIKRDDFKKITIYKGPDATRATRASYQNEDLWNLYIRAIKADNGSTLYQIYILESYVEENFRLYNSAYDSNGNKFYLTVIDRTAKNCTTECLFKEYIGLNVTRDYLINNQETGIRFKLSGKSDEIILLFPPAYIKAIVTGFEIHLKEEFNNKSKVLQNNLPQLETQSLINLPILLNSKTDMQSLEIYRSAINAASINLCKDEYRKRSSDGTYCLAQKSENKEDKIQFYKEAANLGHSLAKNDLAIYYDSLHRPELSPQINQMMTSAAKSGIPHAQVSVGWWNMTGEHSYSINYSEAMQWNLKAYKQGHSEGANNIGELYEKGLGVTKDIEQARDWYKKSSFLGNKSAVENLKRITP